MQQKPYTIPQMIAAHNRAVRMDRRLAQIGTVIGATVSIMGLFAVSMGVITLAAHLVTTAAYVAATGGVQ